MSRPTRHLVRMILFLGMVIALVAVFHVPLRQAFMANPAINGVIITVFVLGVIYVFRQVGMLSSEIAWMEMFRRKRPGISVQTQPRLLATIANAFSESEGPVQLLEKSTRALLAVFSARRADPSTNARHLTAPLCFLPH